AAHRAQAGTEPADVPTQQHQVGDHTDGCHRMAVLGDAHAPAGNHALGLQVDLARAAQVGLVQSGFGDDRVPGFRVHVGGERVEAAGVPGDEVAVEQRRFATLQRLAVALQRVL